MHELKHKRFKKSYTKNPSKLEIRAVIRFFTIKSFLNYEKLGLEKKKQKQKDALSLVLRAYLQKFKSTPHANSPANRANYFGYKYSSHFFGALSGNHGLSINNKAIKISEEYLQVSFEDYIKIPLATILEAFHEKAERNHLKYGPPKDIEEQKYFRDLVLRAYYLTFRERPKQNSDNDNAKYFGYSSSSELYTKLVNKKRNRIRSEVAQRAAMILKEEFNAYYENY